MGKNKDFFDLTTCESFENIQAIQGAGGILSTIDIDDIQLIVKAL